MTQQQIQFDWSGFLRGNPHVERADSEGGGAEQRRHPRFRLADAPVAGAADFQYKLVDFSRSGFGMFASRAMGKGDTLWITDANGRRMGARVVASRGTAFDSSFLPAEVRNLVHCEFHEVLSDLDVASMLTAFQHLRVTTGDLPAA